MARAGILYSDVAKAATKLIEDGRNPTVDSVRDALGGTGSKSTIAPFLKRWKAEHQGKIAQVEAGLPPSLLAAVHGLHQHMQAEVAQQLAQAKQQHAEALRAAAEREQQLRTERDAAIAAQDAATKDLTHTRGALAQLQANHHAQSVIVATVQAENAGLQQRLADRAAEVATLDHQLSQARTQFEHYQEATAAQRAEERQAYEQRSTRLEHDLTNASRHIAAQQAKLGQQEARIAYLDAEQERQEHALHTAQEELTTTQSARDRLTNRLEDTTAAKEDLGTQLVAVQQLLIDTRLTLAAQECAVSMLADQVRRAEDCVDQLTQEKLAWVQERAVLEHRVQAAEQKAAALISSGTTS
jgi:chromosome segregation ATPase